jgi:hypothetical protein
MRMPQILSSELDFCAFPSVLELKNKCIRDGQAISSCLDASKKYLSVWGIYLGDEKSVISFILRVT